MFSRFTRRVQRAMRLLMQSRRHWRRPGPAKIVIMDPANAHVLIPLFHGEPHVIVPLGGEEIYLAPSVLFATIKHLRAGREFAVAHTLAVLEQIRPLVVVTFIDNSHVYQQAARYYQGARFIAVQNGNRLLDRDNGPGTPQIYHADFVCLGQLEVDQFTRHGAVVKQYHPVGSIKDSYYRAIREKLPPKKRYDLCLISQVRPELHKVFPQQMESCHLLALHVRRYAETHGMSVCVALRKNPASRAGAYEWERNWFQERLGDVAEIVPNARGEYTTYGLIDASTVSLAMHSTVLREGFGRRNRILSCNFTGDPVYDFPIPGPWGLSDASYSAFEMRLSELLEMSDEAFNELCGDWPEYLIGYDAAKPTHVVVEELIADALRTAPIRASVPCLRTN